MSERLDQLIYTPSPEQIEEERTWIAEQVEEIGGVVLRRLARSAAQVRRNAYNPYSSYSVGASLLTVGGDEFNSCNAETVTFTETDHAERSVITKAISEGAVDRCGRIFIKAVAVSHSEQLEPCGGCRQRIAEHADNCLVIDVDDSGEIIEITSLGILLPRAFSPSNLGIE